MDNAHSEMTQDKDELAKIIDRMVLYEILDDRHHFFTDNFIEHLKHTIQVMQDSPKHAQIYENMSDFEFTKIIVLPRYLATVSTAKKKYNGLPEYQKKRVNTIEMTWREISEEDEKVFDFERMSDEQWYELDRMSRIVCSMMEQADRMEQAERQSPE